MRRFCQLIKRTSTQFRRLFVLRERKDDGIVVPRISLGTTLSSVEGSSTDAAIAWKARLAMKEKVIKRAKQASTLERGVNLDVPGRAIIAQADERIRWHKQTAATMEAELKTPALAQASMAGDAEEWKQVMRRTDLQRLMNGHLEYARFLGFVRQHIVRDRLYRLGLSDMSMLEIMPKGSYH